MNKDPRIIDEESRNYIRTKLDENYFVEAGAGSGKTTVLVDRMVEMIAQGKDISHISAITFTKAAANEFYDRFQKKLVEKSLEEKDQTIKDRYLYALQNIDLAFMGTIDSFCNMIMSEHPVEGKVPSNASIIDDDIAQELYKREYANIQNGLYNNSSLEEKAKTFLHYESHPEELFILTLNSLLSHRDCELVIPAYSKESIDDKYSDEIKTVRKIVSILNKNINFFNCKNNELNEKLIKAFSRFENTFNDTWNDNIPNLLYAYSQTFGHKEFRVNIDPVVEAALQEGIDYFIIHDGNKKWYEINPDKLPKIIEEINANKYAITLDFVNDAKNLILEKLRKEGKLTFNDYLVYLRDTLREDAKGGGKLIKHIYERHKYFLIDEFQDTDPIQAEIFFYLAAKDIKPNWKECVPHKGSLFIVGDPKQSIYRFKNADVASYLKVEEMFKQPIGEVLYLYKNFRSTYQIKDWFNNAFTPMLTNSEDQAQYENIPIEESEKLDGFTGIYKYDVPYTPKEENDKDEVKVRNIILKLYNNDNYLISEKKNHGKDINYRKLDWSDFMVITPSKPALANYTKAFREVGIPYYVEGNIVFSESQAFDMFVNFFGAVVNPIDNRYLYNILKSNLFNITEAELNEAKNNGYCLVPCDNLESDKYSNNFNQAISIINDFNKVSKSLSPSSLFTKIINEIEGFKKQGTENMEYVYFALELLKSKETSKEIITNLDALHFFEKLLYENNNQERCPGLQKDGNQVHLANLHKVKGLESPVVILAHPRRKTREVDFRITRGNEVNKGYLFNVSKRLDNGQTKKLIETKQYDETLKLDEQASANAELLRLEYVAATRAKNVLIISASKTKDGLSKENMWLDLLEAGASKNINDIELILANDKAISHHLDNINYDDIEASTSIIENNSKLIASNYTLKNPSKLEDDVEIQDADIDLLKQKLILENNGDSLATIIGTMSHRMMELLVLTKDKISKENIVSTILNENITPEFEDRLDYFKSLLNKQYDVLHNGGYIQKGKAPQNILPIILEADAVYPEVPFTYLDENNMLWNGIIDLIYEKDNKLHIIDWKTNINDDDLDEHYKNQLEAYVKVVKQVLNKEVEDALIYHISIKEE